MSIYKRFFIVILAGLVLFVLCQYIFVHFFTTPRMLQPLILNLCGIVRDDTITEETIHREKEFIPMWVKRDSLSGFNSYYETYKDPYYVTIIKTQLSSTSLNGFEREQKLFVYDTKHDIQKIYNIIQDNSRNIVGMVFENGIVSWVEYKDWSNPLNRGYKKKICF